jgi:hypothetical protein
VVRQGLIAATIGVAAGIGSAIAASRILESVLFEIEGRDPWTFATVGLGLLAVCRSYVSPGKTGSFGQPCDDPE